MKNFLKMTLAVICGLLVFTVVMGFLSLTVFGALLAAGSSTPVIPSSGVLKIDMSKITLAEQSKEGNPLSSLTSSGNQRATIGLWDAVQSVNDAAFDPAVKYIYLKTDGNASGISSLEEFRAALARFREISGKPVVAYMETPGTGEYYLASVSDKIYMSPNLGASYMLNGVGGSMMFFGELLDKLGVNVQLIRHGKYKSAGETYTRSSASPENLEQNQRMVDAIWEVLSDQIAKSRELSTAELNSIINNLKLVSPQDFVDAGLVDRLLTREELENQLAVLAYEDEFSDVKMISFSDYVAARVVPTAKSGNEIAIVYADGEIIDGSDKTAIDGDRFASIIAKLRKDDKVKAVVLRVNSPGGSVTASEKIKTELDLLKAEKPLVASYGTYAASGGYWISSNCEKIYSDATTLTGSIGVFGMVPDLSKTFKNVLHVNIQNVTSNKHGDMYSGMRPLDQAEYNYILSSIESVYDRFTTIVADGRSLPKTRVDEIGQGRVWTGTDALSIQLVDEIGTLEDAVIYAAALAGDPDLSSWKIKGYPKAPTAIEELMEMFSTSVKAAAALPAGLSESAATFIDSVSELAQPAIYARMDSEIHIQ